MRPPAEFWERFTCDLERGVFWRGGERADTLCPKGYRRVKYQHRYYAAHRLIWLHVHGDWPVAQIDHINGDRADNRPANLRMATPSQNAANRRQCFAHLKGVRRYRSGRFGASIKHNGLDRYLGSFSTAEAAHAAYMEAAVELFGEFARAS